MGPAAAGGSTRLRVRLLGPLEAEANGDRVALGGVRQRGILALLALSPGRVVPVSDIVDGLWGDAPPATAGNTVQVHVSSLRKALGPAGGAVVTQAPGYRLDVDPEDVDSSVFERLAAAGTGDARAQACALWRGAALADLLDLPFAGPVAARLELERLDALEAWIDARLDAGEAVAGELEELTSRHPYRERLWELLVLAHYRAGRQADALAALHRARDVLVEDLGLDPGPELAALEQRVLTQDPELRAPAPASPGPDGTDASDTRDGLDGPAAALPARLGLAPLPVPLTPLVGRQPELAAIADVVRAQRLVTLTGPGGVGKTRLALEAARLLTVDGGGAFPDGASFVDLADVLEPSLAPAAIAAALGADAGVPPLEALAARLDGVQALVVLDNFEQLTTAADDLARLLSVAPGIHLLVTSRVALRLSAEHVVHVDPLPTADAVELFVVRAGAVDPAFVDDGGEVAELCARLDGLPLALELAAARMGSLTPGDLLARLDDRSSALASGPADLPFRHRALQAAIDGSLGLLAPAARRLFTQLGVFATACTLDAVESVCLPLGEHAAGETDLLDALDALVRASLVRREGRRYRMLETIRGRARADLAADPALAGELAERHAAWVASSVSTAFEQLTGAEAGAALDRLRPLAPEVASAVAHLLDGGALDGAERASRLLLDSRNLWFGLGRFAEARVLLARAAAAAAPATAAALDSLRGIFAKVGGDPGSAEELLRSATDRLREHAPTDPMLVNGLCHLAAYVAEHGDPVEGSALAAEAVTVARRMDDPGFEAMALDLQAYVAQLAADVDAAVEAAEAAVAAARMRPDQQLTNALAAQCLALATAGRVDEAQAAGEEALERARGGSPLQQAETARIVGEAFATLAPERAAGLLVAALPVFLGHGDHPSASHVAVALARAVWRRDPVSAGRLLGAAGAGGALASSSGELRTTAADVADGLAQLLGTERFAAATAEGAALGPDALIDLARSLLAAS